MAVKGLIKSICAYEVLDSRGYPTVACKVTTVEGIEAKAMVPSGASTGEREALELRDGDKKRFMGKGVLKAVDNVNKQIAKILVGKFSVFQQKEIDNAMIALDQKLSGSKDNFKKALGANATLSVSMAVCRVAALVANKPLYQYIAEDINNNGKAVSSYILPVPMLNVINGGAHADNTIDFQEFMFMPIGATTIKDACRCASECFHTLAKILKSKGLNTSKGDEGGFAPLLASAEQALDVMVQAIKEAGYKPGIKGGQVAIALDSACSEIYDGKNYVFNKAQKAGNKVPGGNIKTSEQMIKYLQDLAKKYPIISIEDGLAENDWNSWITYNAQSGKTLQIVGDDLYCTNPTIAHEGIVKKASNSILIKLNQIGTISETVETIREAKAANWTCVVSHRSGETEDSFIADFAVGMSTGQIKTGSMSRSERIAKYNRLIEIENELGKKAKYLGIKAFSNIKL